MNELICVICGMYVYVCMCGQVPTYSGIRYTGKRYVCIYMSLNIYKLVFGMNEPLCVETYVCQCRHRKHVLGTCVFAERL